MLALWCGASSGGRRTSEPTPSPDSERIAATSSASASPSDGRMPGSLRGEHGLARTGRTAHEHVVTARRRDDERLDRVALADHLGELGAAVRLHRGRGGRDGIEHTLVDIGTVAAHHVGE